MKGLSEIDAAPSACSPRPAIPCAPPDRHRALCGPQAALVQDWNWKDQTAKYAAKLPLTRSSARALVRSEIPPTRPWPAPPWKANIHSANACAASAGRSDPLSAALQPEATRPPASADARSPER